MKKNGFYAFSALRTSAFAALICLVALHPARAAAKHDTSKYAAKNNDTTAASTPVQSSDLIADPYIGFNRAVFAFNTATDQVLINPIVRGYRDVVPHPVRAGLRNFLRNLSSPVNFANNLLQGNLTGAGHVLTRTIINTFVGGGGLFDVASAENMPYVKEDLGQTMGVWGIGNGTYWVLPLVGPTTTRDSFGILGDSLMDPLNWYLHNIHEDGWVYARWGATYLDRRDALYDALDDLRRNSFDYYVAVRSAYVQNRAAEVRKQDGKEEISDDHP